MTFGKKRHNSSLTLPFRRSRMDTEVRGSFKLPEEDLRARLEDLGRQTDAT